jgi:hypothetical protein
MTGLEKKVSAQETPSFVSLSFSTRQTDLVKSSGRFLRPIVVEIGTKSFTKAEMFISPNNRAHSERGR